MRTPQRHNSESVLYMNDDQISLSSDCSKQQSQIEQSSRNNHRLFPVSTYTETTTTTSSETIAQDNQSFSQSAIR